MRIQRLIPILAIVFRLASACAEELPTSVEFEESWRLSKSEEGAYVRREILEGKTRTRIGIESPGTYAIAAKVTKADTLYDAFVFSIYSPEDIPEDIELIFHVKDVDFWWYQKLLSKKPVPGEWTEYFVPLYESEDTVFDYPGTKYNWVSKEHFRPFDSTVVRKMREVGITLKVPDFPEKRGGFSRRDSEGNPPMMDFFLTHTFFQVETREVPELNIANLDFPRTVPQYEKFEAGFDLTRCYANPFDPAEIDVTAHFITPSGKSFDYPCFYFQNYLREPVGEYEKLTIVGAPYWKLRIAPIEKGEYTWWITTRDRNSEASTPKMKFEATAPVSSGFVRVSKTDPLYFEFSDGTFFYPIGINLHCTYDDRFHNITKGKGMMEVRDHPGDTRTSEGGFIIDRRSYYHTDVFEKMRRNGMNATEIWLASWGYEVEWRSDWKGYAGINHYNMENAWRLDFVTESARKNDIFFNLVLHCHGQFAEGGERGEDGEFDHHPYNRSNGGFLRNAYQLFYDGKAFNYMMKRMRYVIARYGYSRNIFSWEIISETDLTAARVSEASRSFILKYADRLRDIDVHNHLITNHYSYMYSVIDSRLMRNSRMDYITGDAYRGKLGHRSRFHFEPFYKMLKLTSDYWNTFSKPGLITEAGCCWFGGPEHGLYNDVHQVCWASWMTHLAGTSMFWWVEYIDEKNLYWQYKAFAEYAEGEDKRGRNLRMRKRDINVSGNYKPELSMALLTNKHGGYAWIYDIREYDIWTQTYEEKGVYYDRRNYYAPEFKGVIIDIDGLVPGKYKVEIWDTYSGEMIANLLLDSQTSKSIIRGIGYGSSGSASLIVPLPPFRKDIALKIKSAAKKR